MPYAASASCAGKPQDLAKAKQGGTALPGPAPFEYPVGAVRQRPEEQEKPRQRDAPPDREDFLGERLQRESRAGGQRPPIGDPDGQAKEGGGKIQTDQGEQGATDTRLALERTLRGHGGNDR